ncbi:MAG: hypothetical protein ACI9FJ_001785 [Alteromonadaceae bacterium]
MSHHLSPELLLVHMRIKYPLGIQTFSKIIKRKLLYVDKTAIIYALIEQGSAYFLSRPRRFGKSLLISTLEALFSGEKGLFEGLAIFDTDYDFTVYPLVMLELSRVDVRQGKDLEQYIVNATNDHARQYDIALERDSYEQRFVELVTKLYEKTGEEVVFFVDEYDKPILDNIFNDELQSIKNVMNRFYATVKSLDRYLRFVFITGVFKVC